MCYFQKWIAQPFLGTRTILHPLVPSIKKFFWWLFSMSSCSLDTKVRIFLGCWDRWCGGYVSSAPHHIFGRSSQRGPTQHILTSAVRGTRFFILFCQRHTPSKINIHWPCRAHLCSTLILHRFISAPQQNCFPLTGPHTLTQH